MAEVLPEDLKGRNENLKALSRRFWQVNVHEFLRILGVKLLSPYELKQLKKAANMDPRKIFMAYDYARDCPTGEPLKSAAEYQQKIKDAYYGK